MGEGEAAGVGEEVSSSRARASSSLCRALCSACSLAPGRHWSGCVSRSAGRLLGTAGPHFASSSLCAPWVGPRFALGPAAARGVSQPAVAKWKQVVPRWGALKVEELTDGELKPDWAIYGFRERKLE